MRRPVALAGLAVVVVLVTTGCGIQLPDDGPVVESRTTGSGSRPDAMTIDPLGPQPGQSPSDVVKGFLDAMLATPIRDDVAREFLAATSKDSWSPAATIIYDGITLPRPSARSGNLVDVTVIGADQIDERGSWQGALAEETETDLSFTVQEEDGEWRVALPKDQLIVPREWYTERFRQVSLYFFDPTSQVLVPDPVFVPRGVDLASILVQRLIAGPSPDLVGYSRNLLPAGVDPEISVPVSDDGVATVDLGDVAMPGLADRGLLVSQLAWTLRQDTSVSRLQVLVDGEPITLPGDAGGASIATGLEFAPYVASAGDLLYGLDDGLMVAGSAQSLVPVGGPFGQVDLGLRSVTPDLAAQRAAGVTQDGSTLYLADVRAAADGGSQEAVPVVQDAADLLTPAWDFQDRLWMVDRNGGSAVVSYLPPDGSGSAPQTIDVPGISGEDVKSFLVSRDGSRLVAVLKRAGDDALVVSRLLLSDTGRVVDALPARQVDVEEGLGLRIKDIAWLSPTSVVVLHPVGEVFQVRTASVDGAPGSADDLSLTLDGRITGLAGSPNPSQTTYAITSSREQVGLIDLSGGSGGDLDVEQGVTSLGYVG